MTSAVLTDFKQRVEDFLARTGMGIAVFGRLAINDGSFVADLREGKREPRLSTMETVDKFMAGYVPEDDDESEVSPKPGGSAGPVVEGKAA